MNISLTVNGKRHELEVKPGESLREALRGLGCTSVKQGCGAGECGACTVLVDGVPQTSCNMLAVQADGKAVRTVEGEAKGEELSPVQQAFIENKAFQCGFCTPGLVMTTTALAESGRGGDMTEGEIRRAISGHMCRCTGYDPIVDAVRESLSRGCGCRDKK
ncbi:(2Fe-2S)-binding protein [Solidesulfovibrio sp.]|uniref:(2Fe-2S)-binding protein n=1 Tax=Solidesulfovibrio sp. TaxID=2910990 RepID=UPI0026199EA3|nr:(2Fe-2S)-binding protein [Solidesulfovibrio sp.]